MILASIYHQYKQIVYNLALQYVQNTEEAEEITQDVFLAVHDKIHTFREQSKISTWLYRITVNKSLDYLKAKKRKKRFGYIVALFQDKSEEKMIEIPDFNHPGILLEHREELETIFRHINALPDNQKTVVMLLKIEQLSQSEVADIMEISTKAVESLFQRAKNNLFDRITNAKENEK